MPPSRPKNQAFSRHLAFGLLSAAGIQRDRSGAGPEPLAGLRVIAAEGAVHQIDTLARPRQLACINRFLGWLIAHLRAVACIHN
jgi:hypothetical protein